MKQSQKPSVFKYWEYVLCYVVDVLVISHEPQVTVNTIGKHVALKDSSVASPSTNLGANVFKHMDHDGNQDGPQQEVWAMSPNECVKEAIQEVERELSYSKSFLPKWVETPLSSGYHPELNFSSELDANQTNYFQGLIGVLQ
jgi:hypothetical protein